MLELIIARMKAERATSCSDLEIERCLIGCVSKNKLIECAKSNKLKIEIALGFKIGIIKDNNYELQR